MQKFDGPIVMVKKLLVLTPFKTSWELVIFQEWVPSFNVDNPRGIRIPIWIILRKLLVEFRNIVGEIAARLGIVLG